jgi:transposase-like protein
VNHYSAERKASVVSKLLPPMNRPVVEVSQEEGIALGTLYHWRDQARSKGLVVPGSKKITDDWPGEARLATVIEVASLSASELSRYCREKGLYVEQVARWRAACVDGQGSEQEPNVNASEREELRASKKRIRELERELVRKEKALAEVAALLVLRKKLNALWGDNEVN